MEVFLLFCSKLKEPPSIGKVSLIDPLIYKRLKELDAEIPKEFNPLQDFN